jgi:hypothetical protein
MEKLVPILNNVANSMAENTTVIIVLMGVVGSLAGAIVAANLAMRIYAGTVKAVEVANTLLANSFTSLQTSVGVLATGIGIAAITLQAFYELFREGPQAIRQTIQPFKDFALFVGATVATIGNGVLGAVELVARGINSMVNDAINAINFLNPTKFGEIPNVPMPNFPKIPVPNFGTGEYIGSGAASVGSGAAREGGVGQILAGMTGIPTLTAPLPSVGGGGGGGTQGPSYAPVNGPIGYVGGIQDRMANRPDVTINVTGGISTSAQIGQSVVDALTQYTQVYGPLNLAIR